MEAAKIAECAYFFKCPIKPNKKKDENNIQTHKWFDISPYTSTDHTLRCLRESKQVLWRLRGTMTLAFAADVDICYMIAVTLFLPKICSCCSIHKYALLQQVGIHYKI